MKIAIVGFGPQHYDLLCEKMEELIEGSQMFLFYVLCGKSGMARKWAEENGAPIIVMEPNMDEILRQADYLVVNYDGSKEMHKMIMKFSQTGKHGTVVQSVPWQG